jgi:hypothetical protein
VLALVELAHQLQLLVLRAFNGHLVRYNEKGRPLCGPPGEGSL